MKSTRHIINLLISVNLFSNVTAQKFVQYTTTEGNEWQENKTSLSTKASSDPVLKITGKESGHVFRAWGTCFNELDLDAIQLLKLDEQEKIMHDIFSPDGDLRFTRGRLTMNANDYSRAWYSCDTVEGDFQLKYFNIEHDKANVIKLIKMAQKWQPKMTFWVSPWSPPSWMKINNDYCVMSSTWNTQPKEKDYLLFGGDEVDESEVMNAGQQQGILFPKQLASQSYMIQDSRYLQTYADMFCKFIDLYQEESIPIDMVMYQNEAYSYTAYPGCPWTADGTLRFNRDYLIPTLQKHHPEVTTYIGTLNTNRLDYVEKFIDGLKGKVGGIGLQWEGRQIIDSLRERYPDIHLIQSESECGNGQMDWRAGEHTFHLLCDYIGKGCDEYYIWNFILCDQGRSPWGWKQNALIQVKSSDHTHRYTPEFYAVKHFSHLVSPGSRMVGYISRESTNGLPVIVFLCPDNKYVVIAGNQSDEERSCSVGLGNKYLNMSLLPHSFNSYISAL